MKPLVACLLAISLAWAGARASAQEAPAQPPKTMEDVALMRAIPDPKAVAVPKLAFDSTPEEEKGFNKYYYFHRADTSFEQALTAIRDCDNLARGLSSGMGYQPVYSPYAGTLGGAIGGAIGNALADAIYGSAQRRKIRRLNMRTCMFYKGYQRFGLSKPLWEAFNFEEGFSGLDEAKRQGFLAQQAKVASGTAPATKELGR